MLSSLINQAGAPLFHPSPARFSSIIFLPNLRTRHMITGSGGYHAHRFFPSLVALKPGSAAGRLRAAGFEPGAAGRLGGVRRRRPPPLTYVNAASGSDSNDCLTALSACRTIQAAIDLAANSDVIQIAAEIYTGTIDLNKSLTLIGSGPTATYLDGENSRACWSIRVGCWVGCKT